MYTIASLLFLACATTDADTGAATADECPPVATTADTDTDPPAHQLLADAAEVMVEAMLALGLTAWSGPVLDGERHLVVEVAALSE